MENIEFLHQNILFIVPVSLLIFFLYLFYRRKKNQNIAVQIPFLKRLEKAEKKVGFWKNKKIFVILKWISFISAIILLTISLARPQKISTETVANKKGVDILIALDVSESMLAEDLEPNRIEAAKKYIENFVSKLKTDRVGLEVFAGKTFTQSPMSFDYNLVRYYLNEISTNTINQQIYGLNGTAIGDAILSAENRFKKDPDRTKVLILLTDGEANVGVDPVFAAEDARAKGIKIYTIGIGKKEGALMPIGVDRNGQKIYARNRDGSFYRTKFDEKTLKDIAKISNGEYFWAGNNEALKKSLETIGKLEKKEYKAESIINREDLFYPFLWYGLVLAFLTWFLEIFLGGFKWIKKNKK